LENGFFGVLSDIGLEDYIQLICMKNATKGIRVSQQNDKGLILIRDGKVMYAAQDNLLGMEAFFRIMSWEKGSFHEVKIKLFPPPNIDKDYRHLLLEAAAQEDHANRVRPAAVNMTANVFCPCRHPASSQFLKVECGTPSFTLPLSICISTFVGDFIEIAPDKKMVIFDHRSILTIFVESAITAMQMHFLTIVI
jgi:hypothetical protein